MPKFEFCALHYLNQWLTKDEKFHTALAGSARQAKLVALFEAAAFYRVARNVPERFDVGLGLARYEPVLELIEKVSAKELKKEKDMVDTVVRTSKKISSKYGDRKVLSLTSKMLWLKHRYPVIIYDGRARKSLKLKTQGYVEYVTAWRQEYQKCEVDIKAACDRLIYVKDFSIKPEVTTPAYIKNLIKESWFLERVFDMHLWFSAES